MKPLNILLSCAILCMAVVSCTKPVVEDAADKFVGTYSVSVVENVVWGYDSGTVNDNGTIFITKLSATKIQVDGYLGTTGEVVGNNVYFEGTHSSDGAGYLDTSFGVGTLAGNVLTFTANQTGQLASNGVLYPFRNSSSFTAIKQN